MGETGAAPGVSQNRGGHQKDAAQLLGLTFF